VIDSQSRSEDLILRCNPWRARPKTRLSPFSKLQGKLDTLKTVSRLFIQRIRNGQIYMRNDSAFFSNFNQMNLTKPKYGFDEFLAERRSNYTFWSAKSCLGDFENGDILLPANAYWHSTLPCNG
jgi:hypothetical protein